MTPVQAARWYARRGFPVLPCQPRGKRPMNLNGLKGATTDLAAIDAWRLSQSDQPDRAEALRRLVRLGLKRGSR